MSNHYIQQREGDRAEKHKRHADEKAERESKKEKVTFFTFFTFLQFYKCQFDAFKQGFLKKILLGRASLVPTLALAPALALALLTLLPSTLLPMTSYDFR